MLQLAMLTIASVAMMIVGSLAAFVFILIVRWW